MIIKTENTAIRRNKPSRPTLLLAEQTLYLPMFSSVLDYGCGRGDDVEWLGDKHQCYVTGYDPNFAPYNQKLARSAKFDVVLCNYVLCAIPEMVTRFDVLSKAWSHVEPKGTMMISVRSATDISHAKTDKWQEHGDGWITSQHTFQHGYTEDELLAYVHLDKMNSYEMINKDDYLIVIIAKQ